MQRTLLPRAKQEQCCKINPERVDIQEEKSGMPEIQQWHKKPRHNTAAMYEGGEDNRRWLQRMKQETGATSENQGNII
jgi:hypothetical protein